jgi:uncharacterized protein involved in exopolysaccharide biosynthesis
MGLIKIELEDLRMAELELDKAIAKIRQDRKYVQKQYETLQQSWVSGFSAEEFRRKMEEFIKQIEVWSKEFELKKETLVRLRKQMEALDQQLANRR